MNIILAGVGGQGNVMASRVLANMLVDKGLQDNHRRNLRDEQRGGSVMSHIRVSGDLHLEPADSQGEGRHPHRPGAHRGRPGHADLRQPGRESAGEYAAHPPRGGHRRRVGYPSLETIQKALEHLTSHVWMLDATDEAMKLGNPILSNIIMIGAVSGLGLLPVQMEDFVTVIGETFPKKLLDVNRQAFQIGRDSVK